MYHAGILAAINPYIGPFAFQVSDESRFFGRKKETEQLINQINDNQLTVLFGASGTGKTSLIHAKLFPELKRLYFHPVYIRINFATDDPLEFTRNRIITELRRWQADIPDFANNQSLIDYAARASVFKGLVKPVLFFDQFEELFSLGYKNDRKKIDSFMQQLGDLIEQRLPAELKSEDHLDNLLKFKVVLSLREDRIAELEDYVRYIPSLLKSRFRLNRFTPSQAIDAIVKPTLTFDQDIITEDTAKQIVKKIGQPSLVIDTKEANAELNNLSVDPIVLSIYCYELFELVKNLPEPVITRKLVEKNDFRELIRNYYNRKTEAAEQIKELIEDKLLNDAGIRLILPLAVFAGFSKDVTKEQVLAFANTTGIVRIIGGDADPKIEIIHDQVAAQIFQSRTEREAARTAEKLNAQAIRDQQIAEDYKKEASVLKINAAKAKRYSVYIAVATGMIIITISLAFYTIEKRKDLERARIESKYRAQLLLIDSQVMVSRQKYNTLTYYNDSLQRSNITVVSLYDSLINSNRQVNVLNDSLSSKMAALRQAILSKDSALQYSARIIQQREQALQDAIANGQELVTDNNRRNDTRLSSYREIVAGEVVFLKKLFNSKSEPASYFLNEIKYRIGTLDSSEKRDLERETVYNSSGWFKEGHFLQFENIKVSLTSLSTKENSITIDICEGNGICTTPIHKDITIRLDGRFPFTFRTNNYIIALYKIGRAGNNVFTPAAYISFVKR